MTEGPTIQSDKALVLVSNKLGAGNPHAAHLSVYVSALPPHQEIGMLSLSPTMTDVYLLLGARAYWLLRRGHAMALLGARRDGRHTHLQRGARVCCACLRAVEKRGQSGSEPSARYYIHPLPHANVLQILQLLLENGIRVNELTRIEVALVVP
ncbi:hypothetical protein ZEAMMB73_Zm00001d008880 [Zea mays]|uniref:Uncharacterized protein n=1 Tax=Zea mays TaxID=4577 RepID=A0A1D6FGI2_MAIZE|nr:hypothetical protein ZEAMMB73_Zm00001d008880 [Zea mays]